jgi:subtilisin-like proprotein convertase family protein
VHFVLTVSYSLSPLSPQTFEFDVQTGQPSPTLSTFSYTGPAVAIPDSTAAGVNINLVVSGVPGTVNGLKFSIDGATCTATAGATTVGLDHTWVGDVILTLKSPMGTTITLMSRPGGILNDGNNFCQTVLDDAAVAPIQAITPAGNPYTGSFKPASALGTFNGQSPNGTWTLNASDRALFDTGSVRAFSLKFSVFVCDAPTSLTTTTLQQQEQ